MAYKAPTANEHTQGHVVARASKYIPRASFHRCHCMLAQLFEQT